MVLVAKQPVDEALRPLPLVTVGAGADRFIRITASQRIRQLIDRDQNLPHAYSAAPEYIFGSTNGSVGVISTALYQPSTCSDSPG